MSNPILQERIDHSRGGSCRPRWMTLLVLLLLGWFASYAQETTPTTNLGTKTHSSDSENSLSIQRIVLKENQIAAELQRVKQGILVQMDRPEFEQKVDRATRGLRKEKELPQLVEAKYRATLEKDGRGNHNLLGNGEWTLIHRGDRPALLSIDPLTVALRQPRWTDNRSAIIGAIDTRPQSGLALFVESKGEKSLLFDWSSHEMLESGEVRFDLQFPLVPVASLELNLPLNLVPLASQSEILISGPTLVEGPEKRHVWQIRFGGQSRLELVFRDKNAPNPRVPLLRSRINTIHDIRPDQVRSKFDISFEVLSGSNKELVFSYHPDLTPTEVVVNNLESWKLFTGSNNQKQLLVRLQEPARGGRLEISATSTLQSGESSFWSSPSITLKDSILRSEEIELRVSPSLQMASWQPGSFQLTNTRLETDRTQVFTLQSTFPPENKPLVRPRARIQTPGTEYQVQEQTEWHLTSDRSTVTVQLTLEVVRGRLLQLPLQFPSGWSVEGIESSSRDFLPHLSQQGNQSVLEFPQPLSSGESAQLTIRLGQAIPLIDRQFQMPFPEISLPGARNRSGLLRIRVSPAFSSIVQAPFVEMKDAKAPQADSMREFRYTGQIPSGTLYLQLKSAIIYGGMTSEVSQVHDRISVISRLKLRPDTGILSGLWLRSSAPIGTNWKWNVLEGTNRILKIEKVDLASISSAIGQLGLPFLWIPIPGLANRDLLMEEWWYLTFAQPLDNPIILQLMYESALPEWNSLEQFSRAIALLASKNPLGSLIEIPAASSPTIPQSASRSIPLLSPLGMELDTHRIRLHSKERWQGEFETEGLVQESSEDALEFRSTAREIKLTFQPNKKETIQPNLRYAQCITALGPKGIQMNHLSFQLRSWGKEPFQLTWDKNRVEIEGIAINGRLLSSAQIQTHATDQGMRISFSIPESDRWQTIEVVSAQKLNDYWLWSTLESEIPQFPIPLVEVKHLWRLPPDLGPVADTQLFRLPGKDSPKQWFDLPHLSSGSNRSSIDENVSTRLPFVPPRKTFGESLEQLARQAEGILIDRQAIGDVQLQANKVFGSKDTATPFWKMEGLIEIPLSPGWLLTTPAIQSRWIVDSPHLPESIRESLHQASLFGRDDSGRFCTAGQWLQESQIPYFRLEWMLPREEIGWTAWESSQPSIDVVRTDRIGLLGTLLGLAILLFASFRSRWDRRGNAILLIGVFAILGGLALTLPNSLQDLARGPLFSILIVGFFFALSDRKRISNRSLPSSSMRKAPSSTGKLVASLTLFLAFSIVHAAPETFTVYLLPQEGNPNEFRSVLVPPRLVERLREIAEDRLPLPNAWIVSDQYRVELKESEAEGRAKYVIHNFSEEAIRFNLPLGGVRLRDMMLDGAAAYPQASGSDRFVIEIKGKGEHRLEVSFAIPITGQSGDREFRFSIPETIHGSLELSTPKGKIRNLQLLNWRGQQKLWERDNIEGLSADLGRSRSIHVRWDQDSKSGLPQVRVQELHYWDVEPSHGTLFTSLDYRIFQGTANRFQVVVPEELEIGRIDVRPPITFVNPPPAWVKNWSLTTEGVPGGFRLLTVELQTSVTGRIRLQIEFVPKQPLTIHPQLRFPYSLDPTEVEAYLAFRAQRLEVAEIAEVKGATEISPSTFFNTHWSKMTYGPSAIPNKAYRRNKNELPLIKPTFQLPLANISGTQNILWWLTNRRSEVRVEASWKSSRNNLSFIEWEVPESVVVREVRGTELQAWSRFGTRVQAWLLRPLSEVRLQWTGFLLGSESTKEQFAFQLPNIHPQGVAQLSTNIHLHTLNGWSVTQENIQSLNFLPTQDEGTHYETKSISYGGQFRIQGPQSDGRFRISSTAKIVDSKIEWISDIEPILRKDRSHSFTLTLQEANGFDVQLVKHYPNRSEIIPPTTSNTWQLSIHPNDMRFLNFQLKISRSLNSMMEIPIPRIALKFGDLPARMEQTFIIPDDRIALREGFGWKSIPSITESANPDTKPQKWEMTAWDWKGSLVVSPTPLKSQTAIDVNWNDTTMIPLANSWLYRSRYQLVAHQSGTVHLHLPENSTFIRSNADPHRIPPRTEEGSITFSIPQSRDLVTLEVVWTNPQYLPSQAELRWNDHLLMPQERLWSLWSLSHHAKGNALPLDREEVSLLHAETLLDYYERSGFSSHADPSTTEWVNNIHTELHWAELGILSKGDSSSAKTIVLKDWLHRLQERLPDIDWELPPVASTAFHSVGDLFHLGVPISFREPPNLEAIQPPANDSLDFGIRFALLILGLGLMGIAIQFVDDYTRIEQIVLLGFLLTVAFGWSEGLPFLLISAGALLVRIVWVGQYLLQWVKK